MADITLQNGPPALTPATGNVVLYTKTDKKLYQKDDTGAEALLSPAPAQSYAKAWVRFSGGPSPTIASSYNVASISRPSLGEYLITFISPMNDTNYVIIGNGASPGVSNGFMQPSATGNTTTTAACVFLLAGGSNLFDPTIAYIAIFGN